MSEELNPTVYIAVGAPGSGKSTWWDKGINNYILPKNQTCRINMDSIRKDLTGDDTDQSQNALVAKIADKNLLNALANRIPLIYWDNTSAKPKYRKNIIKEAKKAGYRCVAIYFNLPYETILERNGNRERVVPEDIVKRMYDNIKLNPPTMDEGYDNIITVII